MTVLTDRNFPVVQLEWLIGGGRLVNSFDPGWNAIQEFQSGRYRD
jgi:hypothetical protein